MNSSEKPCLREQVEMWPSGAGGGRKHTHDMQHTHPQNTQRENTYSRESACSLRNEGLSSDAWHQGKKPSVATCAQTLTLGWTGVEKGTRMAIRERGEQERKKVSWGGTSLG